MAKNKTRAEQILSGLNDVQRQAASHLDGPLVVFAGAGSGKTRIITHRIAWLIEQGVKPWEILAVTFTNKAALEMRHRVEALTPMAGRCLISTFHSACARWLREFAPDLGFTADFTIYDDSDQLVAIKKILAEMNIKLDEENTAQDYRSAINRVKTMAMLPNDERLAHEYSDQMPLVGVQVYKRYQEYLAKCNAMDFGDLIMNVLLLLRRNDGVRELLQERYQYILVDEYQDTNRTQFELIARLAERRQNLFVVGDDDQSIYSWRGAVPSNIIDFDKVYPSAKKITMEQNYRCSGTIVEAASAMVCHNVVRVNKRLFTDKAPGDLIDYRLETDNEIEAWWVTSSIKDEKVRFAYADVAIFYRTNSQSRLLEDALRREDIPYQIYGTVRFYDRAEVKDLMAYIRVLINPSDDVSVKRILNVPTRGIGKKAESTLDLESIKRGLPLMATIEALIKEGGKQALKLAAFAGLIAKLRLELLAAPVATVLERILQATGYVAYVEKKHAELAQDKMENIHELGAALADFAAATPSGQLSEWLQKVTLVSSEVEAKGGVSMMTLHSAKGLEFRRVFIVGMEEGLLPHRSSSDDKAGLEEERRLFYVGMTRAKEKLSLVSAYRRRTFNTWAANRPSRFLAEIPHRHFAPVSVAEASHEAHAAAHSYAGDQGHRYEYEYEDPSATRAAATQVTVGQWVGHPTYGKGTVEELVIEHAVLKAVVRFQEFGLRKVSARHITH